MTDAARTFHRHLERLRAPARPYRVDRPCTRGDGIHPAPDDGAGPEALAGRLTCFVPASGAATRLFSPVLDLDPRRIPDLEALRRAAAREAGLRPALDVVTRWAELPIVDAVTLPDPARDLGAFVCAVRDSGLPGRPKALLPFHRVAGAPTSPIRAHLAAALALAEGTVDVHFTASADLRDDLAEAAAALAAALPGGGRLRIAVSVQDPATDLPAIELDGRPVQRDGRYVCRPGGHGALLHNLPAGADLLLVHNIDNAPHPDRLGEILPHRRRLLAALLDLVAARDAHVRAVRARPDAAADARRFLATGFGLVGPEDPAAVLRDLDRPIRVCGMVPDDGQPGGGPFWGPGPEGRVTTQIVEGAEIDRDDPAQAAALAASTHFNPVDLACALRDADGATYDLDRFVDGERWIVTTKTMDGRPIRCLEHPGLWNGGMAGWLTRFVEMPPETFNPVKTLHDLFSPRHRGAP
jgi:hypothetical protein